MATEKTYVENTSRDKTQAERALFFYNKYRNNLDKTSAYNYSGSKLWAKKYEKDPTDLEPVVSASQFLLANKIKRALSQKLPLSETSNVNAHDVSVSLMRNFGALHDVLSPIFMAVVINAIKQFDRTNEITLSRLVEKIRHRLGSLNGAEIDISKLNMKQEEIFAKHLKNYLDWSSESGIKNIYKQALENKKPENTAKSVYKSLGL